MSLRIHDLKRKTINIKRFKEFLDGPENIQYPFEINHRDKCFFFFVHI